MDNQLQLLDLPEEMMVSIFNHLDYKEKLNIRLSNHKIKYI
jgi:hypothetical protein